MSEQTTINSALKAIDPKKLLAAGATNIQMASPRTFRFDLPEGKGKDGINRIKVTARENGTLDVRLIEMIERDLIGGVAPDALPALIANAVGIDVAK